MEELKERVIEELPPKFSGKFQATFPDGKVQYDGVVGEISDFPLTNAELEEYKDAIREYKNKSL